MAPGDRASPFLASCPDLRCLRPSLRHPPRFVRALGAVAAQCIEPMREIDVVAAKSAFGQHQRDFRRQQRRAPRGRIDNHARQPRRQRQCAQRFPFVGDATGCIERAEFAQQSLSPRASAAFGGASMNASVAGSVTPHCARSSTKRRQIGAEYFRLGVRLERSGLRLVPQAIANARRRASGAAAALIGGGARHAHGLEPRQADIGLVARYAREPASRPRCARHRWSARFPRSMSPARSCAVPAGAGAIARSCVAASSAPNSGTMSTLGSLMRSRSRVSQRRISAAPGRNTSIEPSSARSARVTASVTCASIGAR